MKCVHLIVSGRVQGVFFRDNVRRKANELELHGYAKNLEDGNVEIVAQGNEEKVEIGKKHMVWGIIGIFVMIGVYGILNILSGFWYDIGSGY